MEEQSRQIGMLEIENAEMCTDSCSWEPLFSAEFDRPLPTTRRIRKNAVCCVTKHHKSYPAVWMARIAIDEPWRPACWTCSRMMLDRDKQLWVRRTSLWDSFCSWMHRLDYPTQEGLGKEFLEIFPVTDKETATQPLHLQGSSGWAFIKNLMKARCAMFERHNLGRPAGGAFSVAIWYDGTPEATKHWVLCLSCLFVYLYSMRRGQSALLRLVTQEDVDNMEGRYLVWKKDPGRYERECWFDGDWSKELSPNDPFSETIKRLL